VAAWRPAPALAEWRPESPDGLTALTPQSTVADLPPHALARSRDSPAQANQTRRVDQSSKASSQVNRSRDLLKRTIQRSSYVVVASLRVIVESRGIG
jgi:hypothetical protein